MPGASVATPRSCDDIEQAIKAAVYTPIAELRASTWGTPEPVPFVGRRQGRKLALRPGQRWSKAAFDCAWFHFTGTVPPAAAGREIVLLIDLSGEGCVVDAEGRPLLGLTSISSGFSRELGEPGKRVVPFRPAADGGETVDLWVEAGANDLFGIRRNNGVLQEAAIAIRYPDYIFGASQPQQYAWVKEHYPSLYEGVKQRVAEGRWEVQGAMWVESDINVPSGESLIRQILYGKRFFREEFGKEPVSLWQPDVFGYSGSLPQLLVKSGVRR